MRDHGYAALGARAAREALAVVARDTGVAAPLTARLAARPFVFGALSRIAPRVVPCDLETYLRVHFTKVGDQMRQGLAGYLELGRRHGQNIGALNELEQLLIAAPPPPN